MRSLLRKLLLAALGTIVVLGGLEVTVRALDLAPAPATDPALARVERFHDTFYRLDEDLIFRLPPGLETDFAELLPGVSGAVTVNEHGYRGPSWQRRKDEGTLRIVCLGDSVTFGFGAGDEEAYPARLAAKLREQTDAPVEVLNLGVPGYSTYQGIRMMELEIEELRPDVLVVGFGFNDGFLKDQTEREYHQRLLATRRGFGRVFAGGVDLLGHSALFRFLGDSFSPASSGATFEDPSGVTPRVPIERYRANLEALVERAAAWGIYLILINTDFPNAYPLSSLEATAAAHQLPWIDLPARFAIDASLSTEGRARPRGELAPSNEGETAVVLRMKVPNVAALPPEKEKQYDVRTVAVPDPAQRLDFVMTRLRDDGEGPDAEASDGIWTGRLDLPASSEGEVAFRLDPELGAAYANPVAFFNSILFHRLSIPALPPDQVWETEPIAFNNCPFKQWMLPQEDIHPNAKGYDLMATMVADTVRETGAYQRHLRQR